MIKIKNNKIFINDVVTTDPTLIGLAILDQLENDNPIERKKIILEYIKDNSLRFTTERKIMIDIVSNMQDFEPDVFVIKCEEALISRATAYNFIDLLKKAEIIVNKKYFFL